MFAVHAYAHESIAMGVRLMRLLDETLDDIVPTARSS